MHPAFSKRTGIGWVLAAPFLYVLSKIYAAGLWIDRSRRRANAVKLPLPVISVGNISVGGTGKTPLLMKLVSDLRALGKNPAVLTRGYKSARSEDGFNDETRLLMEKFPQLPLASGADRVKKAGELMATEKMDLFLLDDGFQHWPIKREKDIVCVDATDPWGGGLLPLGFLREPPAALQRAGLIVLTRVELIPSDQLGPLKADVAKKAPGKPILTSRFAHKLRSIEGTDVDQAALLGKTVLAVSAIGNPAAFEENVRRLGGRVVPRRFADHHFYTIEDLKKIEEDMIKKEARVVITEKDWVKIRRFPWPTAASRPAVYILSVDVTFDDADQRRWMDFISR